MLSAGCSSGEEPYTLEIFARQNAVRLGGAGMTVDEANAEAVRVWPDTARWNPSFDDVLESPSLCWLRWRGRSYEPFAPPAPGRELILPALDLPASWFADNLTTDPLVLFRIFHYPPDPSPGEWGVGEHTDYGLLTILLQDESGGLQVRTPHGWIDAPAGHRKLGRSGRRGAARCSGCARTWWCVPARRRRGGPRTTCWPTRRRSSSW